MGTLEQLLQEVTRSFHPLIVQIENREAYEIFAELGLQLPLEADENETFSETLMLVNDAINTAVVKIGEVKQALEDGDKIGAVTAALEAVTQLKTAYGSFVSVGISLRSDVGAAAIGITQAELEAFIAQLPIRLGEYLLITTLENYVEPLVQVLELLQVVERTEVPAAGPALPAYTKRELRPAALLDVISHPGRHLENLYDWNKPSFDGTKLFPVLAKVLLRAGFPVIYDEANAPNVIDAFFAQISIDNSGPVPGLSIKPSVHLRLANSFNVSQEGWELSASSNIEHNGNAQLSLYPDGKVKLTMPGFTGAQLAAHVKAGYTDKPLDLLTITGGSGVTAESFEIDIKLDVDPSGNGEFAFTATLNKAKVTIDLSGGDGFTKKLSGSGFETEVTLKFGYSTTGGFFIEGSGGLQIKVPTHISLGPVDITALSVALTKQQQKMPLTIGGDIRTMLGPLQVVVQDIGCSFELTALDDSSGNLGRFQLSAGFKAPSGIGLSIDAGGIKGGGILNFNPDNGEYFGGMELEFRNLFSMKAFGIINTRMPDGSEGFSMLIIITAEFSPVQLGFGFALNGVGGLLGINRTARIDVLREGIKTNTLKSILFPENIVANISRIVSDIKQVFPPQNGHTLLCPMGKISWATPAIITLELGILIETQRSAITILGVLKVVLPTEEEAILKIQVNFLGQIDFEKRFINFDAILYDSRILTYTLTGTMAMRVSWGSKKVFVVTMGGFHPSFKEIPADLQSMQRITLSLLSGNNPRITLQCYYALTANTLQFGAKAELYAEGGGFNIYGFVGFDALFQRKPLYFITDFAAGIALRRNTSVIMGIKVSGSLSGPTLWEVRGKASVSFFFFSISVGFHAKWGLPLGAIAHGLVDLLGLLAREIADTRNWKADLPGNNTLHVSIKKIEENDDEIVVHPFGVLTFSERLVPLEVDIQKFGEKVPQNTKRFEIKPGGISSDATKEDFAAANFLDMKDEEKLARPSFEQMKSGFRLTGSGALQVPPQTVNKPVDYEFAYLREQRSQIVKSGIYQYAKPYFKASTKAGPVSKAPLSYVNKRLSVNAPEAVEIGEDRYAIAHTSNMSLYSEDMVAGSYAEAQQLYNELLIQKPELRDQVQILSQHELNSN